MSTIYPFNPFMANLCSVLPINQSCLIFSPEQIESRGVTKAQSSTPIICICNTYMPPICEPLAARASVLFWQRTMPNDSQLFHPYSLFLSRSVSHPIQYSQSCINDRQGQGHKQNTYIQVVCNSCIYIGYIYVHIHRFI